MDRYYLAQLVWDESMSRNLAERLGSDEGAGRTAVVLAGMGHIAYGLGVPLRAQQILKKPFAIVLPVARGKMGDHHPTLRKSGYPKKRGDLLWEAPISGKVRDARVTPRDEGETQA